MTDKPVIIDGHVFERRGDRYVNDATGLRINVSTTRRPFSASVRCKDGHQENMIARNGRRITFADLETCIRTALEWMKNG